MSTTDLEAESQGLRYLWQEPSQTQSIVWTTIKLQLKNLHMKIITLKLMEN